MNLYMEKWLRDYRYNKKKFEREIYLSDVMEKHKEELILEKKKELYELKKRIKHLEMELEGMGIRDSD